MENSPVVLCIDDSKTVISFLSAYLKRSGFCVETAFDGEEGLKKMRSVHPDIVLLDLNMPKLSGFDVALSAANDPFLEQIPIVVLTSLSQSHNKERSELRNVCDYLTKPVDPARLVETIQKNLKRVQP